MERVDGTRRQKLVFFVFLPSEEFIPVMVAVTNGTARVLLRTLMTRERSAFVGRVRGGTETKTGFAPRTDCGTNR